MFYERVGARPGVILSRQDSLRCLHRSLVHRILELGKRIRLLTLFGLAARARECDPVAGALWRCTEAIMGGGLALFTNPCLLMINPY